MTLANLELYVGNRRSLSFRLRRKGTSGFVPLSSAQQIRLEYRNVNDQSLLAPVVADRLATGADWVNGRVVVMVDNTGLTARVGTYHAVLTVIQDGEDRTYPIGVIDVKQRPVPLASSDPITGVPVSYTANSLDAAVNVGDTAIIAGMPIARFGQGIVRADWNTLAADGVAISAADPGVTCLYVGPGAKVRRADWSYTSSTVSLPAEPSAAIYLGPDGQYVSEEPVSPTAHMKQVIGEVAADGQTLLVTLDYLITL